MALTAMGLCRFLDPDNDPSGGDCAMVSREYRVERASSGGYFVYSPTERMGFTWTLWGARRMIRKHKAGRGPGSIAHKESA